MVDGAVAERGRARTSASPRRRPTARRRPSSAAARRASMPVQVSRVQDAARAFAYGRTEVVAWKSPDGKDVEGLADLSGRATRPAHGAAAGGGPRRPDRRLRPLLHGRAHAVSGGGLRGARLRRPARATCAAAAATAATSATRNYRDWGGGDYRDIMSGVDALDREGRRRPRAHGRHGLELRRLHDVVDHHADEALQGGVGGRGRHEPHVLHRHRRHPRLHPRLLRRRVLGRVRTAGARTRRCSTSRGSRRPP